MLFKLFIITKTRGLIIKTYKNIDKNIKNGLLTVGKDSYEILNDGIGFHSKGSKLNIFGKDYFYYITSQGKIIGNSFDKDGNVINKKYLENTADVKDEIYQELLHSKVVRDTVNSENKEGLDFIPFLMLGVGFLLGIVVAFAVSGVRL
jgi:hypothetical protein